MMFAAREDHGLPRDYGGALLQLHDREAVPQFGRARSPSSRAR